MAPTVEGIRQTLESYGYGAERLAQERGPIGGTVRSTRTAAQRGGPKKAAATCAANKATA